MPSIVILIFRSIPHMGILGKMIIIRLKIIYVPSIL